MLAVMKHSFATINEFTLPLLYKTMVRPLLSTATLFGDPLERLTNKDWNECNDVRPVWSNPSDTFHTLKDCERLLGLPSLYYRRRRGDMVTVHQLLNRGMAVPQENFLMHNMSEMTRGHLEAEKAQSNEAYPQKRFQH